MEKVQMFRTTDGSLFETETETEALKHEKRTEFKELYETDDRELCGTGIHGLVYAQDLIEWASENPDAFRALVDAVIGSTK